MTEAMTQKPGLQEVKMKSFDEFYNIAVERKGGEEALSLLLPQPKSREELAGISDDRILSAMTKAIFEAGFVWRVVANKWDGFEEVFHGFEPELMAALPEPAFYAIASDERIIRNRQKVMTVPANAHFLLDIAAEHGSMAHFIAHWPEDDIVGLWALMKKRGQRLGGVTGPRVLRVLGKDTFLLTQDVVTALTRAGVVSKAPTSLKSLRDVQDAFNHWRAETGMPLCHLSKILSCSVARFDEDFDF